MESTVSSELVVQEEGALGRAASGREGLHRHVGTWFKITNNSSSITLGKFGFAIRVGLQLSFFSVQV